MINDDAIKDAKVKLRLLDFIRMSLIMLIAQIGLHAGIKH